MPSRPIWKGFVQFSLVSIPVQAHTATDAEGGRSALNQLHRECNSRIRYRKTCPLHGEVPADQIVSGYQFGDGQYVVIEPDELDRIRSPKEKVFNIESFIDTAAVDPAYFSGRTWYLLPEGRSGLKPFVLLRRAIEEAGRVGFARIAISGRQQLVLLRPVGSVLAATMLSYDAEVRRPDEFEELVTPVEVPPDELKLARTVADRLALREFELSAYKDDYTEKLSQLIKTKVAGKQVIAPPPVEAPPRVINLMEALQQSLEKSKRASRKPPTLRAPTTAEKTLGGRRRKSS